MIPDMCVALHGWMLAYALPRTLDINQISMRHPDSHSQPKRRPEACARQSDHDPAAHRRRGGHARDAAPRHRAVNARPGPGTRPTHSRGAHPRDRHAARPRIRPYRGVAVGAAGSAGAGPRRGGMRRRAGVCSVQRIAGNHLQPVQRRRIPFRRHATPDRRAPGLRPRPRIDRRPAACDPGRATVHRGRPAPRVRLRTPRRSPPRPCRCRCTSSPCRSPSSAGGACRAPTSRCESLRSPPADGQARWRRRAD